jgi:hypothetical protein
MKPFWPFVVSFGAGAVLGQFTENVLFPAWAKLGLAMPVVRWIASFGNESLDWIWLILNTQLMSWLVVALVSVIGGFFIKRHLLFNMLLFGIGFTFVPLALHAYLYSSVTTLLNYEMCIIIVGIAVICGHLSHRFRLKHTNRAA